MIAKCESDMQTPLILRTAKGVEACLNLTVPDIGEQQQRLVEKDLLGFRLTDPVFVCTLARVSWIPLKALTLCQINHGLYMTGIYIWCQPLNSVVWNRGAGTDTFVS